MGGWLCEWMGGYTDTWMVHERLYGWINGWLFLYFFYKIITWDFEIPSPETLKFIYRHIPRVSKAKEPR